MSVLGECLNTAALVVGYLVLTSLVVLAFSEFVSSVVSTIRYHQRLRRFRNKRKDPRR